ncbi:uncharacterized protein LOC129567748 [Sitodiplosis mosellana]|uniref:uncharacterized protein LOC129567748 n=1 Tax=Sitodiplosis mosellana TaxID=263140 RepID=UPI0024438E33|nr:uncharacterized protein LOC129567748 [Sitodiplosis mosellana]
MDEKLEKYRLKVRRKEFFNKIKQRLISMMTFSSETNSKKDETIEIPDEKLEEEAELMGSENGEVSDYVSSEDENRVQEVPTSRSEESKMKYIMYGLWFCFWATCWMIAIEMKFGIVYLLFSALFGIYFNTRTGPRREGEISAYSVFNENCESIQGTLKGEQLEREMIYGPLAAVH